LAVTHIGVETLEHTVTTERSYQVHHLNSDELEYARKYVGLWAQVVLA